MWEALADRVVYGLLAMEAGRAAGALHFFLHETLKIGFLLLVVTHLMGLVQHAFPLERVRAAIADGRFRGFEHLAASSFGAVTPFCSCSSIPLFIGFLQGGIPLGVTFSFLITSPLVNEVALALFLGMFGWKVTLVYAVSGIALGTALGFALGRLGLERWVEAWVWDLAAPAGGGPAPASRLRGRELLRAVSRDAFSIFGKIGPYVVAGVGVGAAVHGYVPTGFFERWLSTTNPFAVPAAVLAAVPLYANAAGVIPIMEPLVDKGVPLGTALAFMMAVVGLSLPEAMILKKVMRPRLLATFFGSVAVSIVALGYGFNAIL